MEALQDIEIILNLLVTPSNSFEQSTLQHSSVESRFKFTLHSVKSYIWDNLRLSWLKEASNSYKYEGLKDDIYWDFATFCLQMLLVLRDHLGGQHQQQHEETKRDLCPDVLSIQMQKAVRSVLQFVICLGISRNLLPGVGTPLQLRSKFGGVLIQNAGQNNSSSNKQYMLLTTVNSLMACSNSPALGSLIFTQHLGDVLAAVCQLCYFPIEEKKLEAKNAQDTSHCDVEQPISNLPEHADVHESRCSSQKLLEQVINKAYQPLLMRELLILQGPQPSQTKGSKIANYKSPSWLKTATRQLLSQQLMKKNGVKALIEAILGLSDPEESSTQPFIQKCNVVAKMLATPVEPSSTETYFESICSQVLNLFHSRGTGSNHSISTVASLAFGAILVREPKMADIYLIKPLLVPLLACSRNQDIMPKPTEDEISFCITTLHKICVLNFETNDHILKVLSPLFGLLMNIFSYINTGVLHLRNVLEELLCHYIKYAETSHVIMLLKDWMYASAANSEMLQWNNQLILKYGQNGGVAVSDVNHSERNQHEWLESDELKVDAVLSILSRLHNEKIVMEFFLETLEELSLVVKSMDASSVKCNEENDSGELLHIEERIKRKQSELQKSLQIFRMLSELCQQQSLLESLLLDTEKMIKFISATLERGAKLCEKDESMLMDTETLTLAITVLSLVAQSKDSTIIKKLKGCLPPLKILAKLHRVQEIRAAASELYNSLITHGVASLEEDLQSSNSEKTFNTPVDNACGNICKDIHVNPRNDATNLTEFHQAWHDLHNHDPPIKGHAMILLSKLIQSKDPETLANKDKLLTSFQESLNHDDTYIYLMAIRSLSCLADAFPDVVLPCLINHYSDTQNRSSEIRLKVGEVLMKTLKVLGDITPRYRDSLLGAFLKTSKDSDPFVRASSITCLGDLCKGLRYSLGPFVHQVVNTLINFIKYDTALEVRRAATQSIAVMLRGMGKDSLKILEDNLKDIYNHLKHIYSCEKDDIMKLHAQLALEELDAICRDFLFPKPTLEKKVKILEPL